MTTTSDVRAIFQDAISRMEQGDIRDATEKAWCATLHATEALILARAGQPPNTSTAAGRRLRAAAEADPSLGDLRYRYLHRQVALHGECFNTITATRRRRNDSSGRPKILFGTRKSLPGLLPEEPL